MPILKKVKFYEPPTREEADAILKKLDFNIREINANTRFMARVAAALNCEFVIAKAAMRYDSLDTALDVIDFSLPGYRLKSLEWVETEEHDRSVVCTLWKGPPHWQVHAGKPYRYASHAVIGAIIGVHWRRWVFPSDFAVDKTTVEA